MDLKTAPSFVLLGRGRSPSTVRWTTHDRILALAVHQLEKEVCDQCGTPSWLGHTSDGRVEFELDWHVCYGCQAKAEMTEGVKPKPGEYATVKVVPESGEPGDLPNREEGYAQYARPMHTGGDSAPRPNELRSING